jgi:protein tyrosine/serine phosphatase
MTKRRKWTLWVVILVPVLCYWYYTTVYRISKNFYEVDPGKFYRSAQLSPDELNEAIEKYGIKSVLTLRGSPTDSKWMAAELEIVKEKHLNFYDAGYTLDYFPTNRHLHTVAEALKNAPRPLLVHCRTGADRTGEVSAIYAVEFLGKSKDEAIHDELNFKHWHVQAFHPAKAEFVRQWKGLDWALNQYDLCRDFPQWAEKGDCSK